ncbi:hypothetical protein LEP1GSC036_2267 [Leptospira weilii str. 2006001853]|uniref:Uncharacterized protein n=1 Tax=Leptospira weilii str. 2006001853 TaxID=1001589 RepID=A0A828Z553_9LEPT|nr:hypothetical protein LEP1GSC036_2267 [Leptospira weilii str. 2006001853]
MKQANVRSFEVHLVFRTCLEKIQKYECKRVSFPTGEREWKQRKEQKDTR